MAGFSGVTKFKEDIRAYREDYLCHLVNGLKHRGARLRLVHFYNTQELRLGYYLEDAHSDGVVGPSEILHNGGDSAFSFYRDLLFNFYYLHLISDSLLNVLRGFLQNERQTDLSFEKKDGYDEWKDIVMDLNKLYRSFFPDEISSLNPVLDVTLSEDEVFAMTISFPRRIPLLMWPFIMRWGSNWNADGITTTYRVPYLRNRSYL